MTRLLSLSSLLAVAALGCGDTTDQIVSQQNLDRPADIAFACYGGLRITNGAAADPTQAITVSAMPTHACEVRSEPRGSDEDQHTPPGQEKLAGAELLGAVNWHGFVLQPGPGTVAVVTFPTKDIGSLGSNDGSVTLGDLDKLTPGNNSISIGEEPVAIATDRAGCHVITANAGSCDLSVLDVSSALDTDSAVKIDRLAVKNASGVPIRAKPAAMVAEPSLTEVGNMCPATPTGLVYIAYPGCHLVAGVDAATGTIVTGIRYDAAGVPSIVGGDVTCPDECGSELPTPGPRPVTLDLEHDPRVETRRLAIGADNSHSIAIVELDDAYRPQSVFQVALEDRRGDLGVTALSLSPQIGMGGRGDSVLDDGPGGQFQFVYAVATDHTVRVADVLDGRTECDTQVDPRFARGIRLVRRLACLPVGDPATPARRAGAVGPGISLPNGEVPFSVAFTRQEMACPTGITNCGESPNRLVGYFAMISASSGLTYVANVDDDAYFDVFNDTAPLAVFMPLALPHQLRDDIPNRSVTADSIEFDSKDDAGNVTKPISCDFNGTSNTEDGPRALGPPARNVPTGSVALEKLTQLPGFRQLKCDRNGSAKAISELSFVAPDAVRDLEFPDLAALARDETWTFTWEGSLSNNKGNSDVGGPAIRESMMFVDGLGAHLRDAEKPFCHAGVEPFDIVQLRGCDPSAGSTDCPSGYTCFVHPQSQVQGLGACMRTDEADRLANLCKDFLTTARRYTVKTAQSGELLLVPRRFELRTTPLDGCTEDAQCQSLADYALSASRSTHPIDDASNPSLPRDTHTWACVADPNRAPMGGTGKRCEMRCSATSDCATGTICAGAVAGQPMSGFCMEGVTPPQACVNGPQRYELHAGEAFTVLGSASGFVHPIIADAAGMCVKDPMASPLLVGRLPLQPKDRL
ncbi:MAG TPA: hypothetical protein VN253_28565, partial [Kofleriaceae bacterium]|nr:hypothetical protein [Kofleriaceae bacterium]